MGEAVTCFLNLQDHYWNVPIYRFGLYFQTKMKGMSMKNFEKGQCLPNYLISFTIVIKTVLVATVVCL